MAPEQLRGEPIDGRADVFALGVVLHEMLVGARPFTADARLAVAEAILTRSPVPLDDIDHGIPRAVAALVLRCLEKAAADRFATAAELSPPSTPTIAVAPADRPRAAYSRCCAGRPCPPRCWSHSRQPSPACGSGA